MKIAACGALAAVFVSGCSSMRGPDLPSNPEVTGTPPQGSSSPGNGSSHQTSEAKGIIVAFENQQGCSVKAVNPDTHEVTTISTFQRAENASVAFCDVPTIKAPFAFTTKYDKIAANGNQIGGYIDANGFTQVGPSPNTPDFGKSVMGTKALGFDKHDNFYYSVDTGPLDAIVPLTTYYRVDAGTKGDGVSIGTSKTGDGKRFGYMPDGTLSPDAEVPADFDEATSSCLSDDIAYDGVFDPARTTPYFYGSFSAVYRDAGYCKLEPGAPVTQEGNFTISSLASNPDGTKVAFKGNRSVFIADATTTGGTPAKISTPDIDGTAFVIKEWR